MADRQQRTFASAGFDCYRKMTRRERFLREVDEAMPWLELIALIEPYYPKEGQPGRPVTPRSACNSKLGRPGKIESCLPPGLSLK